MNAIGFVGRGFSRDIWEGKIGGFSPWRGDAAMQNQDRQRLKAGLVRTLNVTAEAVTHKHLL
jgi:hypothetical protein